jgi:DNA-binding beta-propeller fold protein YncE
MRRTTLLPLLAATALGALTACSDSNLAGINAEDRADTGWNGAAEDNDSQGNWDTGDGFGSETEDDFTKLEPAPTDAYVFVVNAARNTVSRISVPQLQVITADVGVNPTAVETTSDYTKAVVFNEGSDSVSIIDAETLDVTEVPVRDNFNTMQMSNDGRWVICFHNNSSEEGQTSEGGLQSFNEISLVDTETATHFPMAVGFNPRTVRYTPDSNRALVVSDEYVALIDLTAEIPTPSMVQIAEDLLDPPPAEEILVEPSGAYAFVRQFGEDQLVVLDLEHEVVDRIDVGFNPTDIDLSPDGTQATVVSRGSKQLYVIDAQDPFVEPAVLDLPVDEVLGSLVYSPDGTKAVLYTTAAKVAHYTTWDVATGELTVRNLVKPVRSVAISPTGGTLLVFHSLEDAEDASTSSPFYGEHALTMIDLDDFRPNALLLPDEVLAFNNSTDGRYGFFIMEDAPYLEVLSYDTLLYDEVRLKSNPVHVGVLPETTYAYVNQEHDLGRLTFFDPDTGVLKTITGFELNDEIQRD